MSDEEKQQLESMLKLHGFFGVCEQIVILLDSRGGCTEKEHHRIAQEICRVLEKNLNL